MEEIILVLFIFKHFYILVPEVMKLVLFVLKHFYFQALWNR